MGLLIISIVFGGLLGCLIWLGAGDRLPIRRPEKWSTMMNLLIYAGASMFIIYTGIFFWV
ncbi:MAG: hypothetical protein P8N63_09200 [Pseudomonadales bacterium]|nr:hypothetical protein [Pseudomonadales bacterium]